LDVTLVNRVRYVSGPLKWVGSGCNMGELGGVIQWPTHIGGMLGVIHVNCVGYFSGPLK